MRKILLTALTWDLGEEMYTHKMFTVTADVAVYCCERKSLWQRGTSDDINRLLHRIC